ncbi:MAG: hypothetical protein MZW92_13685 [Comamonadaceae bacterium]|nr:hypothetical protein [Comamonadaceae bacterium]
MLGSATPSLESLERVAAGRCHAARRCRRAPRARGRRAIHLIDLRAARRHAGHRRRRRVLAIERHLARGGQVLLYLNRRGYAPTLFCPAAAGRRPARAATRA